MNLITYLIFTEDLKNQLIDPSRAEIFIKELVGLLTESLQKI